MRPGRAGWPDSRPDALVLGCCLGEIGFLNFVLFLMCWQHGYGILQKVCIDPGTI